MQREVNLNSSVRMFLYFIFWRDEVRKNIHGIENFREEFCIYFLHNLYIFSRDEERKNIHGIENLREELCL
jgi:hypothetical protein